MSLLTRNCEREPTVVLNVSLKGATGSCLYRPLLSLISLLIGISTRVTDRIIGRRRKKSCVPRSATPGSCEECFARGVQCLDQEFSLGTKRRAQDGKHDLQQRVAELEAALLSISHKLETTPKTVEPDQNTAQTPEQLRPGILPSSPVLSGLDTGVFLEHAPVLSLFDNAILSRRPDDDTRADSLGVRPSQSKAQRHPGSKFDKVLQVLLSLFPSQQRLEAVLNASQTWWAGWQGTFPQIFGPGTSSNFVQFVADLKASGSVPKVAKALLCLFSMLEEGCVDFNTIWGTENAAIQIPQALCIIDDTVLADDELAGTIDGVECMVLRAKHESNNGRLRKSWLLFRRAISFAQLLGLHKRMASEESNTSQLLRRETLWKFLHANDRLMSLLLGLPYGPSECHSNIGRDSELCAKGIQVQDTCEYYMFRLANVVGHIIDRNQQLPSKNMLPLTFKIETEMMELADSMTSSWWKSGLEPGDTPNHMFSHLLPQFWHHQARALLHLPFMLKATTDRHFEYNKIATLESAREMIARYRVIRPVKGFGSLVCKLMDFQVFTAAMILVLNLLDHYRRSEILDHSEAEMDQDLISVTTAILRQASSETDGGAATQAARALESFGNIKEIVRPGVCSDYNCTARVVIPFFGTVVIGPGTSFEKPAQAHKPEVIPQPQQLPTPGEQSLDGFTPEPAPSGISPMASMVPFDINYGENTQSVGNNGDIFADVNFDVDQDWSWFWNNTDIPCVDVEGRIPES